VAERDETMRSRNERNIALAVVSTLVIVILGCGTGYSITYQHFGDTGQVVVRNDSVEESTTIHVEINEDLAWEDVILDIAVAVESGDLEAVFTDDNGQTLSLSATAGQPASGHAEMETDARGQIDLQLSGVAAKGVVITIDYTRK
jgi:hypothetical protein